MSWSVVIPSRESENLKRCLASIHDSHPEMDMKKIIVVDDGAKDGIPDWMSKAVTWVKGRSPFIYARNVNIGIAACQDPFVVIMGDDVLVDTFRCFDVMDESLRYLSPNAAITSAGVRGLSWNQNQDPMCGPPLREEPYQLSFVCVMLKKFAWLAVGGLDERFTGYGWEDVDYCWRLKERGFSLHVTASAIVSHTEQIPSTWRSRPDWFELQQKNRDYLVEKWGREPKV